jgi:hypothetical protein
MTTVTKRISSVEVWTDEDTGRVFASPRGFILSWTGYGGFGLFSFSLVDGDNVYVDTETLPMRAVQEAIELFCQTNDKASWPELLQKFGGPDEFMRVCYG